MYEQNQTKPTYERMYFYGDVSEDNMLPVYSAQEVQSSENLLHGVAGGGEP